MTQFRHGNPRRSIGVIAAMALTTGAGVLLPASAAHAADNITCTGTSHLAYSPGLTFTPQTVTLTETDTYSSCASSDPSLTSGSIAGSFTVVGLSCANVASGADGYRINWNNGQHSSMAFNEAESTIVAGVQQYIGTGTVASGEFAGDTAVVTWVYTVASPLDCLAPGGLTSQNGTVIVEITGV